MVSSYDADISLLQFKADQVNINSPYINPICIWNSKENPLPNDGLVLGWGTSKNEETMQNTIPKVKKGKSSNNEDCFLRQPRLIAFSSNRTFCGIHEHDSRVCTGDGGSGLFVKIDEAYFLKGLVSTSLSDDHACALSDIVIYTDFYKYTDWIANITQQTFASSVKGDLIFYANVQIFMIFSRFSKKCSAISVLDNLFIIHEGLQLV